MMTMQDAQGQLSSQPMTVLEMDANGCLWMLVSQNGHTAKMAPAGTGMDTVNLSFSDESRSTFISITAYATLSHDPQRKQALGASWRALGFPRCR